MCLLCYADEVTVCTPGSIKIHKYRDFLLHNTECKGRHREDRTHYSVVTHLANQAC